LFTGPRLLKAALVLDSEPLSALPAQLENLVETEEPIDGCVAVQGFPIERDGVFELWVIE
jgi:hypothetical protein